MDGPGPDGTKYCSGTLRDATSGGPGTVLGVGGISTTYPMVSGPDGPSTSKPPEGTTLTVGFGNSFLFYVFVETGATASRQVHTWSGEEGLTADTECKAHQIPRHPVEGVRGNVVLTVRPKTTPATGAMGRSGSRGRRGVRDPSLVVFPSSHTGAVVRRRVHDVSTGKPPSILSSNVLNS